MEFDYTVTTTKTFDAAVESVQEQIGKAGMRVLYVHDVQKTLGEKGIAREPFKIIEFVKDGQIYISGMRPIVLPQFFPDAALGERPKEIDRIVLRIIDIAK